MDREQLIRNLMELTEREQAEHYAYENRLDTPEALLAHAGKIRAFFSTEDGWQRFMDDFLREIPYMLENMNFPSGQRMGLFIHPRFSNNPMHSHDYCEIKYVLHGSARMIACGRTFPLSEGDLYIIAPNCPHQTLVYDRDTLIVNCEFGADAAEKLFPRLFHTPNAIAGLLRQYPQSAAGADQILCFPAVSNPAVGERIVDALFAEKESAHSPFALSLCESFVEQALLLLMDAEPGIYRMDVPQSRMRDISDILAYIGDHLAEIRFSDLAEAFHYNESYLSTCIKRTTGHSFQDIVKACRLDEAARLLTATDYPIEQVMRQVGYSGKTHFYQIFAERFGKTPAEYRGDAR